MKYNRINISILESELRSSTKLKLKENQSKLKKCLFIKRFKKFLFEYDYNLNINLFLYMLNCLHVPHQEAILQ